MRLKHVITIFALGMLSACGNKGGAGTPPQAPPGSALPQDVSQQEFDGQPGSFSGSWRGECVIQLGNQQSDSCEIGLRIRSRDGLLDITQDAQASFPNRAIEHTRTREIFQIQGNTIVGRMGRGGQIGPRAFTLVTPAQVSNNGAMVRSTFIKTAPDMATYTIDSMLQGQHIVVRAELRLSGRALPRPRIVSRN